MRSVFSFLFNFFTRGTAVLLVAMLSVNYIPDNFFSEFPLEPKVAELADFDSVIPQWNSKLSDGKPEFIQLNNILGPESIAISKSGLIYSGLADGRLVEIDPSKNYKLRTVLRIKESNSKTKCQDNVATRADECGRLLQLRFVNDTLYAIEANSGLYMIDVRSGSKILLGPKPMNKVNLYNSFAFDPAEPNLVYITISSTKWDLLKIVWSMFECEDSGKVIAFDTKTGKQAVIVDKILMANGIDVDAKRDRLIFSESMKGRIQSIQLKSIREAFKSTVDGGKLKNIDMKPLITLLPGNPDNIVIEGDLAYIALPFVRPNGKEYIDHLLTAPNVRKALGRFAYGLGRVLELVSLNFYQHPQLESVYRELKCGHIFYRFTASDRSAIIEYNLATGASRFLGSNVFGFVSEATPDHKGNLYLGSFRTSFIVKTKA